MSGVGAYGISAYGLEGDGVSRSYAFEGIAFNELSEAISVNVLIDRLNTTGSPYAFATQYVGLDENLVLDARMAVVWRMLMAEEIDLIGTALASQNKLAVVVDVLHAAGIVATRKEAMVEIAQVLALSTLMRSGWKADAAESVAFSEALTSTLNLLGTALEEIGFADTISSGIRIVAIAAESVEFSSGIAGLLESFARLREDVLFYTTLRIGNDDYVGWVLNDGVAPSEYRNFPMNGMESFAGSYFGTTNEGLFELVGDDDDGDDIDAHFRTAFWDFGTGQLKQQMEAYVALSHDGTQLVFKVLTADKRGQLTESIYTQAVSSGELHSEKMKIGKGLQGTYWQFELANVDGADFEIDSLDFRPLILNRRT